MLLHFFFFLHAGIHFQSSEFVKAFGMFLAARALPKRHIGMIFRAASRPTSAVSLQALHRHFSSFNITFASSDGDNVLTVSAKSGQTILEVAHEHDVDIEGACGGECACSTCHIILPEEAFDKLPEA